MTSDIMSTKQRSFSLPDKVHLTCLEGVDSKCYRYAVDEMIRLIGRLGISVATVSRKESGEGLSLQIGDCLPVKTSGEIIHDGFLFSVSGDGINISANSGKGVLNGVYHLAEQLGFLFLMPGDEGEWVPDRRETVSIPCGKRIVNPRFKHRGVYYGALPFDDFTEEEWLRFYAKLRFNAVRRHHGGELALTEELGLRFEIGGHDLASLLPRDMFEKEPELFRMFQPEDFGGKRMNDANLCVTNPKARRIIQRNFAERLKEVPGAYAIHTWGDDLPAGGWCLCPSCRALTPTDQAMLAMRHLALSIEEARR